MLYLAVSTLAAFVLTLLLVPEAKVFLRSSGIVGMDQQKDGKPEIPTSGGIPVLFGFLVGITAFIGLKTFLGSDSFNTTFVLASLSSVLIISLIGLIDDVHVNGEAKEDKEEEQLRVGLSQWVKPTLLLPAALPLMVVKAGHSLMSIPLLGTVEWGVFYPLVLVPLAVLCVSNATNMLAGQNGLESGMGFVALSSLGLFSYLTGSLEGAVIAFSMSAALLAFLKYNFYPAEVLPGDSLTYGIGAVFASVTVIANIERFAIVVFLPWIFEAFLKLRSGFKASSLGDLQEDGTLKPKHSKVYSLSHVFMNQGMTERQVVVSGILLEVLVAVSAFLIYL